MRPEGRIFFYDKVMSLHPESQAQFEIELYRLLGADAERLIIIKIIGH